MALFEDIPKWDGVPVTPVTTSFGINDNDPVFTEDAKKFATWAAGRLGYPIVDVELTSLEFYDCFETAITDFNNQVNQFNIRENRLSAQGMDTSVELTQKNITGTGLGQVIRLAHNYGAEVGAGGNVDWKRGYVTVVEGEQVYDLDAWAAVSESGKDIEIKRVFHDGPPAISRYYDPFAETGIARNNLLDEFGWGGWQPALEYVLFPIYEDLLRVQAVEFNDEIRRSAYSFQIINNKLTVFPRPGNTYKLWFDYILVEDRDHAQIQPNSGSTYEETLQSSGSNIQSDFSNIQYQDIPYNTINQPGRAWIRKYALACAKETLGMVRAKYQQIPIPDAEITLDGDTLRSEAQTEKEALITELRETLEESSRTRLLEKKQQEEEYVQATLKNVPLKIYIG